MRPIVLYIICVICSFHYVVLQAWLLLLLPRKIKFNCAVKIVWSTEITTSIGTFYSLCNIPHMLISAISDILANTVLYTWTNKNTQFYFWIICNSIHNSVLVYHLHSLNMFRQVQFNILLLLSRNNNRQTFCTYLIAFDILY